MLRRARTLVGGRRACADHRAENLRAQTWLSLLHVRPTLRLCDRFAVGGDDIAHRGSLEVSGAVLLSQHQRICNALNRERGD